MGYVILILRKKKAALAQIEVLDDMLQNNIFSAQNNRK